ncbi:unnamed protein product, partial [marine sediment metagenome]
MELCSDKHGELCYEGRNCPACEVIEELQAEIDGLQEELKSLEKVIE